jgi:hypothetical protein
MKHQTLRLAATCLGILAAINAVTGVAVSVVIGIGAATVIVKIGFVLGGFIITAISAIMLLSISRLILLLISIDEHLSQLVNGSKFKTGD